MSIQRQVSVHGNRLGITKDDQAIAKGGFVAGAGVGAPGIVIPGSHENVAIWEDFLTGEFVGAVTSDTGYAGLFFNAKCTDTGVTGTLVDGTNGVFRITSSATITTPTPAASSKGIVGKKLAWKANMGPGAISGRLRISARVKASSYLAHAATNMGGIFVGFTDTVAHEVPMHDTGRTGDSGASAVSPASDCVGFLWGNNGDTGWRGVATTSGSGGANDSGDQQVTLTTTRPTDNVWTVLEVELSRGISDTGGTATFFIDGVPKGKISSPVNPAIALAPCVYYFDTGGGITFDTDYIGVSGPRDTGL